MISSLLERKTGREDDMDDYLRLEEELQKEDAVAKETAEVLGALVSFATTY